MNKTGIEFHWLRYQYMGPGTHLKKRLARGDPGINRLDRIAKAHDIDYDKAKTLKDKWAANRRMIAKIGHVNKKRHVGIVLTHALIKLILFLQIMVHLL